MFSFSPPSIEPLLPLPKLHHSPSFTQIGAAPHQPLEPCRPPPLEAVRSYAVVDVGNHQTRNLHAFSVAKRAALHREPVIAVLRRCPPCRRRPPSQRAPQHHHNPFLFTLGLYENLCGVGHLGIIACLLNLELSILLDSEALVKLKRNHYLLTMWQREMEWLVSGSDHIVELIPSWLTFPDGNKVMACKPRISISINLPALCKLDNMVKKGDLPPGRTDTANSNTRIPFRDAEIEMGLIN